MAQLDVQRKKKSPIWIWIIVLGVLLGVAFMLYRGYNRSYHPTELKIIPADSAAKDTVVIKDSIAVTDTMAAKTDTAKMDTTGY